MQTEDLKTIEHARTTIEEIVTARYLGVQAVPSLCATDFAALPPAMQEAELRIVEENEHGNRLRVGLHMCLSAASVALQVSQTLMHDFPDLAPPERARALLKCSEDAMAAADAARHAAAVLAGEELPETESFFESSRM
ncbi:MAG: hypothetical protein EOO24_30770 [Comamonadaceae bacterium]|nr:MAG: hypothetical protein EOO24_30770 [Comamonadaceae bacterium]